MVQFIVAPCLLCYYHVAYSQGKKRTRNAQVKMGDRVTWLANQDRTLERWLLDTAVGHVELDIIEVVRKELG